MDEINPAYYIQPQVGYYTVDPNHIPSFDKRSTYIAKEIKECVINESHLTSNLSKRFGYSEDIKQKIEHNIQKLEDLEDKIKNDNIEPATLQPSTSKRRMKM